MVLLLVIGSHPVSADTVLKDSPVVNATSTIWEKISFVSLQYNLSTQDSKDIYLTLDCESAHFESPTVQSKVIYKGVREKSFGYAQINLPYHPEVTYEQATDTDFSIDFIVKNWQKHKYWWHCAKKLGV